MQTVQITKSSSIPCSTQSDTSLIKDQTLDVLDVKTEEKVVNISTINACMPILCRRFEGFKVQVYNCLETVTLQTLYSRHEFFTFADSKYLQSISSSKEH